VQKQILGVEVVDTRFASAPLDEQHIPRLLAANCCGDWVGRAGIDVPTRELLILTMVAALGGCDPQVKAHVAANLRLDNDRARLIDVLTQLIPFIGSPRTLNALRAVDEIAPA
jgi:4-carboxymuconolactone decarboxylase